MTSKLARIVPISDLSTTWLAACGVKKLDRADDQWWP